MVCWQTKVECMCMCAYFWGNMQNIPLNRTACAKYLIVKQHAQKYCTVSATMELGKLMSVHQILTSIRPRFTGDQFNFFLWKHDRLLTSLSGDLFIYTHTHTHSILQSRERSPYQGVLITQGQAENWLTSTANLTKTVPDPKQANTFGNIQAFHTLDVPNFRAEFP